MTYKYQELKAQSEQLDKALKLLHIVKGDIQLITSGRAMSDNVPFIERDIEENKRKALELLGVA